MAVVLSRESLWSHVLSIGGISSSFQLTVEKIIAECEEKLLHRQQWIDAAAHVPSFQLEPEFLGEFIGRGEPDWGFGDLSKCVYNDKYSRLDPDTGKKEQFWETLHRVVKGCINGVRVHCHIHGIDRERLWNGDENEFAQDLFRAMWEMKMLPPGRGLFALGTKIIGDKALHESLNNCAFISTKGDLAEACSYLMNLSMLGVGSGFDTRNSQEIYSPKPHPKGIPLKIPDDREGWVEAVRLRIMCYLRPDVHRYEFDTSLIRPAGDPIVTFGGIASGPEHLEHLLSELDRLFTERIKLADHTARSVRVDSTLVTDLMNIIGRCVISGNLRRTAEIAFGEPGDDDFIDLKNYKINPHRISYGYVSNNSVMFSNRYPTRKEVSQIVNKSLECGGDPGYTSLYNARCKGRTLPVRDPLYTEYDLRNINADRDAGGTNPCVEQTLCDRELCTLVETFPSRCDGLDDFLRVLELATMYAKIITLHTVGELKSREIMAKNRRIGVSQSGVVKMFEKLGVGYKKWCQLGYIKVQEVDEWFSKAARIPRSIKTTSIKPSGTVSLLAGVPSGIHHPFDAKCVRTVMFKDMKTLRELREKGYDIEVDREQMGEGGSVYYVCYVRFPIDYGMDGAVGEKDVSIKDQFGLFVLMSKYWADNQVSCTISVHLEDTPKHLHGKFANDVVDQIMGNLLYIKGVSFLFHHKTATYRHMPFVGITDDEYRTELEKIESHRDSELFRDLPQDIPKDAVASLGCSTDSCELKSSMCPSPPSFAQYYAKDPAEYANLLGPGRSIEFGSTFNKQ